MKAVSDKPRQVRRKRVSIKGGMRVCMYLPIETYAQLGKLVDRYRKELKINVSRSFMIREAVRMQVLRMTRELAKTNKGEFHAKKRQHNTITVKGKKNAA